jgi:aspartate carbamoyltransferase catalytic subunit
MRDADVIYQTRIQKERLTPEAYERTKGHYVIDKPLADSMKEGAIIIHPLPRVGEITPEVDASPHAVYFKQVGYGVLIRMAILSILFGTKK